jgi:hypothetical protein
VARRCRKVGAPRSATASPPPGNRIASLASTSAADFPHPADPCSLSVDCTQYRGRADDSDPAQLVALGWKRDNGRSGPGGETVWTFRLLRSVVGVMTTNWSLRSVG